MDALKADVETAKESVEAAKKALSIAVEREEMIQMKLGGIRAAYDEVVEKVALMENQWADRQAELAELKNERAARVKEADAVKLEAKKVSLQLSRLQKDRGDAEKKISGLEKKYPWVNDEKHAFGVTGGDYDFSATDLNSVVNDLNAMKKEQENLVSHIHRTLWGMKMLSLTSPLHSGSQRK